MSYTKTCSKLLMVAALLTSFGCASHKIANLDEYKPVALEKSKFAPSEDQLKRGRSKVVVFALDENGNEVAQQAHLGLSIAGTIEAVLTESNTAEIVDRKVASKLQEEIKLAEMSQTGAYEGPAVADYAISGSLTNASFTHKFNEAVRTVDKKGRTHVTPPSFRYTAEVQGIIKVYELPSLKVVKTINISDNKGRSEETRSSGRYSDRDDDLVRGAGKDAIYSVKEELKNELSPKAYVIDKKVKDATAIFKINLGLENGAKAGEKCSIYTTRESVNQLTGKTETETVKICDGIISNQITSKASWVVAPAEGSDQVKLGDQVKLVYSKSGLQYLKDAGSMMNSVMAK